MKLSDAKNEGGGGLRIVILIAFIADATVLIASLLGLLSVQNSFLANSGAVKFIMANIPYVKEFCAFVSAPIGMFYFFTLPLFLLLIIEVINLISMSKRQNSGGKHETYLDYLNSDENEIHDSFTEKVKSISEFKLDRGYTVEEDKSPLNLVEPAKETAPISYKKPTCVETVESEIYSTREFEIPQKPESPQPKPDIPQNEFSAKLHTQTPNLFHIEGIDVKVQLDTIRLGFGESNGRDISITVTKDYTNVSVDDLTTQVNFALFKSDMDDEQKVIIQRKDK